MQEPLTWHSEEVMIVIRNGEEEAQTTQVVCRSEDVGVFPRDGSAGRTQGRQGAVARGAPRRAERDRPPRGPSPLAKEAEEEVAPKPPHRPRRSPMYRPIPRVGETS